MVPSFAFRHLRVLLSAMVALAAAFATLSALAVPAQAWPWDPKVQVRGFAQCGSLGLGFSPVNVQMTAAGQTVRARPRAGFYALPTFTNIPKGGTYSTVRMTCNGPFGASETRTISRVFIDRPAVGNQLWKTLVIP